MRGDVLLLVVRSLRRGAQCFRGWSLDGPPYAKIAHFHTAQRCQPQYVKIDRPIFGGRVRPLGRATISD